MRWVLMERHNGAFCWHLLVDILNKKWAASCSDLQNSFENSGLRPENSKSYLENLLSGTSNTIYNFFLFMRIKKIHNFPRKKEEKKESDLITTFIFTDSKTHG